MLGLPPNILDPLNKEILTININQLTEREVLSSKISELEVSLKQPIVLML